MGAEIHKFVDDLKSRPSGNSNSPPRSIKARDLDDNFAAITVIEVDGGSRSYAVNYTKDGITLSFYPDLEDNPVTPEAVMEKLTDVPKSGTWVLGAKDGAMTWLETQDCDDPAA